MHLARHVGSEPFIIGRLVGCNLEDMAIGVLGEQLPAMPKDSLASLSAGLKSLPATTTLAQALRSESKILCDWIAATPEAPDEFVQELPNVNEVRQLWSDPAARAAAVENLRKLFDEAATLLDLPEDKWRAALSNWQDQVRDSDALSRNFPPNLEYVRNGLGRCAMRPALLEAAIEVVRAGPDAVQKTRDPAGDGPFGYDKTEGGFILSSSATVRGEPVTLKVGP
jgi:hypothetical protein